MNLSTVRAFHRFLDRRGVEYQGIMIDGEALTIKVAFDGPNVTAALVPKWWRGMEVFVVYVDCGEGASE